MSNHVVGSVYQHVIEDVISTSRVDFEENGVEEGVLEDLRKGWQKKLSQFNVAQFPWDPKPDEMAANGGVPSTAGGMSMPAQAASVDTNFAQSTIHPISSSQAMSMPLSMPLSMPSMEPGMVKADDALDHGIKLEPDYHNASNLSGVPNVSTPVPAPSLPSFPPLPMGGGNAAARAVQQLQNTFGQRAAASINAIHSGMTHGNQQHNGQRPVNMTAGQQQALNAQQYRAQIAAQTTAQFNGANGVHRSQVDGGNDDDGSSNASFFQGVLMQQRAAGEPPVELGRVEIDDLLHKQMAQRAQQMEGGGLMVPLREATKRKSRAVAQTKKSKDAGGITQTDGADDEDDDNKEGIVNDEDAINSDLDDPDEDREDDDDEDDVMGPIMLCVYDKVQRVKNKWKCTLKDGVLTVNGKEYVFHKATGEYEW